MLSDIPGAPSFTKFQRVMFNSFLVVIQTRDNPLNILKGTIQLDPVCFFALQEFIIF